MLGWAPGKLYLTSGLGMRVGNLTLGVHGYFEVGFYVGSNLFWGTYKPAS